MNSAQGADGVRPRGSNQVGIRQFNERVVLQAIRLNGPLPKAEIARLTHLSAQTVQIIISRLEADALVVKRAPLRGKIGQPSVPMALNPEGAYSIGIKIGRRSLDVLLVDFTEQVRERLTLAYEFPDPDTLFDEIRARLKTLRQSLGPERAELLYGIGIAAPLSLGGWQSLLGVAPEQAAKWNDIDIRARVAAMTSLPVELVKDTAAACVAELVAGRGRSVRSFLYVFIDTFIGGGLVIDSHLRPGATGNAGALGSMPLGLGGADGAAPRQLLSVASLFTLEKMYAQAGLDARAVADARAVEAPWLPITREWMQGASPAIAMAIHSATALLELDGVIVDGSFSREMLAEVLAQIDGALDRFSWEGIARPGLLAGAIGADARAIGGAMLPLYANFAPDRDLFLKLDR
ncbi:Sugar kinase of the NBD/HSP70 family, may contain an N-terminal HTH domain [Variovorax sp. HW608]|uniref:ROK family transcriptional regulator n=1 Tax=Variovorax sp. HW608 TaxID=1034889 RepID=UPI00081FF1BB|nr:ROK family transcriptional regulator [Variovorax sp. HW608]SCK58207.1 Sugar kinase of the NBD/HSP70 family, may contain an N-terminal HTH domain [Variovorax sp. HW608]